MVSVIHSPATIEDISQSVTNLKQNSLVVWDVDGVLINGVDRIFHSENIHDGLANKYIDYIASKYKLNQDQKELFVSELFIQRKAELVDTKILDIMQSLQSNNIPSIALTCCFVGSLGKIKSVANWRINELAKLGVNFNFNFCHLDKIKLNTLPKVGKYYPLYKQGILFCLQSNKGQVLRTFLEKINWVPTKVVFIDDKINNLQSVQEELKIKNIQYIGLHYTGALSLPREIDTKLVKFQYEYLMEHGEWLTDQKALLMLKNK